MSMRRVSDPSFRSVDDKMISFVLCSCLHTCWVRPMIRFCKAEAPDSLSWFELRHPFILYHLISICAKWEHDKRRLNTKRRSISRIASFNFSRYQPIRSWWNPWQIIFIQRGSKEPQLSILLHNTRIKLFLSGSLNDFLHENLIDKLLCCVSDESLLIG